MTSAAGGFGAIGLLLPACGARVVASPTDANLSEILGCPGLDRAGIASSSNAEPVPPYSLALKSTGRNSSDETRQATARSPGGVDQPRGLGARRTPHSLHSIAHVAFKVLTRTAALRRTIASCVHCEDSRSLRYDQDLGGWVCFQGCGNLPQSEPQLKRRSPKKLQWKRSPLFEPYVVEDGVRRKLHHSELREAYRLWAAHKDIREGRFRG